MNVQLRWELFHAQRLEAKTLKGIRKTKSRLPPNQAVLTDGQQAGRR